MLENLRRQAGEWLFNRWLKPPLPPSSRLKPYEGDFGTGYRWEELFCRSSRDIAAALDHCEGVTGPILDLGGGAGRLSLALVNLGHAVTLVDKSETMTGLAKARREALSETARRRFTLRKQDIVELDLGTSFVRVFALSNILDHLDSEGAILSALQRVRAHLASGGIFVFDANCAEHYRRKPHWNQGTWIYARDVRLPSGRFRLWGRTVPRAHGSQSILEYAVSSWLFSYVHMKTPLTLLALEQWRSLFRRAGFREIAVHGGWNGEPLEENTPTFVFTLGREADE